MRLDLRLVENDAHEVGDRVSGDGNDFVENDRSLPVTHLELVSHGQVKPDDDLECVLPRQLLPDVGNDLVLHVSQ